MSEKFVNTKEWQQMCFEEVFLTHKWGNSADSGKTPKTGGYWLKQEANKKKRK